MCSMWASRRPSSRSSCCADQRMPASSGTSFCGGLACAAPACDALGDAAPVRVVGARLHGIEHLLPDNVELVHGPGCPVCEIPMGRIDDAMWLAARPDVIFTCFGDMMRVPGSAGSLLDA